MRLSMQMGLLTTKNAPTLQLNNGSTGTQFHADETVMPAVSGTELLPLMLNVMARPIRKSDNMLLAFARKLVSTAAGTARVSDTLPAGTEASTVIDTVAVAEAVEVMVMVIVMVAVIVDCT